MNRRNLLKSIAALSLFPIVKLKSQQWENKKGDIKNPLPLIKPAYLQPGEIVAVIAPATAVTDSDDLAKAKEALDMLGLKMKIMPNVLTGSGYKSRSVKERIADLHAAFLDKECKAILCLRGGYGSQELLDSIDYSIIRSNPKIFAGYSDVTALLLTFNMYAGLITYHSPVLLSSLNSYTLENFRKMLFGFGASITLKNSESMEGLRKKYPTRAITGGKAKGGLAGGNLTIISTMLGTPYEPDFRGKILFIEDVDEQPFSVARMLNHLRLAGKLKEPSGIIFGKCSECDIKDTQLSDYTVGEIADKYLSGLGIPVLYGLAIGHTDEKLTLPVGLQAELDADKGELTVYS